MNGLPLEQGSVALHAGIGGSKAHCIKDGKFVLLSEMGERIAFLVS